ncbi:hypothetical protein RRG08_018769 [Elysia crispata]|uniref:Uncharacterized protein n=1 Tax=Elysia crispata TaxID=231223 RepID=A0AAE0ZXP6_9GAST|nr:hypothetical protein RRG08_018769 [Elysia crispata]
MRPNKTKTEELLLVETDLSSVPDAGAQLLTALTLTSFHPRPGRKESKPIHSNTPVPPLLKSEPKSSYTLPEAEINAFMFAAILTYKTQETESVKNTGVPLNVEKKR